MSEESVFFKDGEEAVLLRIFIGNADRWHHKPLYEAIIHAAREQKLAGATVLRSPLGYGATSHIHTAKIMNLSADLPMIIEIVDRRENVERFLPVLRDMMTGGLVTLQPVEIVHHAAGKRNGR